MGLFSGVGEFLFGKKADTDAAQDFAQQGINKGVSALNQGNNDALSQLTMGLNNASSTLSPMINQSQDLNSMLQGLLMGETSATSLPGYNAMSDARRDAIGDLGTGMAGTGKFFSGTTAEQAADIGGDLETQFLQQAIQNLMMGAQPGNQATNTLAGMQMGAGTTGAGINTNTASNLASIYSGGGNTLAGLEMGDQSTGAFGDILSAGATLGGAWLGSR